MARYTVRISCSRRALAIYAFVLASLLAFGLFAAWSPTARANPSAQASLLSSKAGPQAYLTSVNYHGNQTLAACGAGYHMASLWEILDTSSWTYAHDHPDALVRQDSGEGTPSNSYGWIRTGNDASIANITGTGNCSAWTSASGAASGTMASLRREWESGPVDIGTWDAGTRVCSASAPVWCMAEVSAVCMLPLIRR